MEKITITTLNGFFPVTPIRVNPVMWQGLAEYELQYEAEVDVITTDGELTYKKTFKAYGKTYDSAVHRLLQYANRVILHNDYEYEEETE